MKKNEKFHFLTLAVLGALAVSSCEKPKTNAPVSEFEFDTNSQIVYSNIQNLNIASLRGGSGCEEILAFETMDEFKHTMNELERQCEAYDDAFVAHFADLDEEELYNKEQELNYCEFKPNTDFENYFQFASSNADYLVAEAQYLEQGDLNEADDPDNHFICEPEERSLLNRCNEVVINDTIYKITENGYFEISDGDFGKLALLDEFGEDLPENVRFVGGENYMSMRTSDCKTNKSMRDYEPHPSNNKRKIKWVISHWTYPWGRYATAKTKNYKKKNNGKWKKYRTYCEAQINGSVTGFDSSGHLDCDVENEMPYADPAYKDNSKKVKQKRIADKTKTQSGWLHGGHHGAGGVTYLSELTW